MNVHRVNSESLGKISLSSRVWGKTDYDTLDPLPLVFVSWKWSEKSTLQTHEKTWRLDSPAGSRLDLIGIHGEQRARCQAYFAWARKIFIWGRTPWSDFACISGLIVSVLMIGQGATVAASCMHVACPSYWSAFFSHAGKSSSAM